MTIILAASPKKPVFFDRRNNSVVYYDTNYYSNGDMNMNADEMSQKLALWIRNTVLSAGCKGVVLGISGGIDSSVLAVLSQKAFPESTLALIMPCHSSEEDEMYARMVTEKFSMSTRKVNLDSVFDTFLRVLSVANPQSNNLAVANIKPRLRMSTLYYFANELKYLVAGSGDRSEITVGYFTKYGDGGADILPLGRLLKSEVRELGRHLGVPQVIIDKPPTPGLWPGQTGEGELGASYEALDHYILTGEATSEVKRRIDELALASNHKRQLPLLPDFEI